MFPIHFLFCETTILHRRFHNFSLLYTQHIHTNMEAIFHYHFQTIAKLLFLFRLLFLILMKS